MTEHCPACGVVLKDKKARSRKSHDHFFARVAECWDTMPDETKERFPSAEHLRKWCLVKSGYCAVRHFVMGSEKDAKTLARAVRYSDSYAVVVVTIDMVSVYTAKSQSVPAMGAKDFQESKDAVFRVISELLGTDVSEAA